MAEIKRKSPVKRFGARYGTRVRDRLEEIEKLYRGKKHKCPYCNYAQVKRKAAGIWHCRKCSSTYTSKAYASEKAAAIFEKEFQVPTEEKIEEKEVEV
ncbi:MAG: 50S ribosomal protein L37ae [Candidatus Woesearchaeota archaeon]